MIPKFNFLFPKSVTALIITGSCLLFNSCEKDAKDSTVLKTTGTSSSSSAKVQFDSAMFALAKSSLVAWYSFESGSLKDRSKHHNDIVFNNATPVADRYGNEGNAYQFDGNSFMRIKNSKSLNPAEEITLFAIIKVSDFYEGPCHGNRFVIKGNDDFIPGHYYLGFDDNYHTNGMNCSQPVKKHRENFNAVYGNANIGQSAYGYDTGYVYKDRWYRIAFSYANGVSKFYVNGRIMTYNNQSAVFVDNKQDLFLGKMDNNQYPYGFNGIIDEVAIFNKALSDEDIATLSK